MKKVEFTKTLMTEAYCKEVAVHLFVIVDTDTQVRTVNVTYTYPLCQAMPIVTEEAAEAFDKLKIDIVQFAVTKSATLASY